jgi:hypothetical protein
VDQPEPRRLLVVEVGGCALELGVTRLPLNEPRCATRSYGERMLERRSPEGEHFSCLVCSMELSRIINGAECHPNFNLDLATPDGTKGPLAENVKIHLEASVA